MNKKKEVEIPIHLDISKELEHEIKNINEAERKIKMDAELHAKIRKFIVDFSNKKRSTINALALAALIRAYKEK